MSMNYKGNILWIRAVPVALIDLSAARQVRMWWGHCHNSRTFYCGQELQGTYTLEHRRP